MTECEKPTYLNVESVDVAHNAESEKTKLVGVAQDVNVDVTTSLEVYYLDVLSNVTFVTLKYYVKMSKRNSLRDNLCDKATSKINTTPYKILLKILSCLVQRLMLTKILLSI